MKNASHLRPFYRLSLFVCIAAALTLSACSSKLLVTTSPDGSLVTVKDPNGKIIRTGPSPLDASLAFSEDGGETYTVEVEPTSEMSERYLPANKALTRNAYVLLPSADTKGTIKELTFKLEEKEYVNVPVVEVLLTPRGDWIGVLTKTRSFKNIAEAGGAVPALVVDFGENRGIQGLALSPDGERIVYSEAVYARQITDLDEALAVGSDQILGLKGANLRGINIAGGGILHVTTEDFRDMFPSYTPKGDQLLFSSNRRRADLLDILRIKASGRSGISNIYVNHRNGIILKPTSASDGTVSFAVANVDPSTGNITDSQIWTVGGPNEFPTQITRGEDPAIAPSGEYIAFIAPDGNLWVTDTDGTNQTQLTSGAADIIKRYRDSLSNTERQRYDATAAQGIQRVSPFSYPSWTPDGEHILYSSMEGSDPTGRPNEDIWIMRVDGSDKQQLTTNGSADRFPLMAPDGQNIYFLSNRGESWAIWRIANGPLE